MISKIQKRERFGIFGGTFDPPHVGHLILAMEAYDQLKLKKVLWVLAPNPPHKMGKEITSTEMRIEMVEAAIGEDPIFEMSRIDIDRPRPHYVLETMQLLRKEYPSKELIFLMGGDSLMDLPSWHQPDAFIQSCDKLGVMHRVGEKIELKNLEEKLSGLSQKIEFIEAPLLEISSNQIRFLVSQYKPYRYYLPPRVYGLIEKYHLYKNQIECKEEK